MLYERRKASGREHMGPIEIESHASSGEDCKSVRRACFRVVGFQLMCFSVFYYPRT